MFTDTCSVFSIYVITRSTIKNNLKQKQKEQNFLKLEYERVLVFPDKSTKPFPTFLLCIFMKSNSKDRTFFVDVIYGPDILANEAKKMGP